MNLEEYVERFSSDGLSKMHLAVLHAFQKDEATPFGQDKLYGVREFSDWKKWADALEAELARRGVDYEKVPW